MKTIIYLFIKFYTVLTVLVFSIATGFSQYCDTLNYPLPGTPVIYFYASLDSGYVSGNNCFGHLAKANYFDNYSTFTEINGALFWFAIATGGLSNIEFAVWDNSGIGGAPGNKIGSKTIPLSLIVNDVGDSLFSGTMTYIQFNSTITISGPFYIGVILPSIAGDTVVLVTNMDGETIPGTGWEMWSDSTWFSYNETWGLNITNAIFPTMCSSNFISGQIYNDANENCDFDSTDSPLSNVLLRRLPGPYYTLSHPDGYYYLPADTGTYTVSLINNNPLLMQTCPDTNSTYTITFITTEDSSMNNNFGMSVLSYCPRLNVNIASGNIRPCFNAYYYIYYSNQGTATAYNAQIEVEFDSDIIPISSSLPWVSQSGNIYTFEIDSIPAFESGYFYIEVNVTCNMDLVGTTKCVTAHIYPDSSCFPTDPIWDHSSVAVEGECVGDSLACFTIYNTGDPGTGDMQGPSNYSIFENDILVFTDQFQLAGGDSIVICFPANGNAIRLEADQRPGHPGNSHPQVIIEACGDDFGTSLGFINTVPQDDYDMFIDIYCITLTGSYDPNDKKVVPEGITEEHYIDSTDVLEYKINFQNTGTDTAFTIVIRDTLSEYLDITTVQSGASSHPYTFNIFGQGILEWEFKNILLPDSNINEPGSHGFVNFTVHQIPNNEIGTIILNRAGIIFDFNEPILTEPVYNIVWELPLIVHVPDMIYNKAEIMVYPNPFNNTATFEIHNFSINEPYYFKLYDNLGKEVKSISNIYTNEFHISRDILRNGIYFYKIFSDKEIIGSGKLIVR